MAARLFVSLLLAASACAQITPAKLTGTVTDATGGAVPGARVVLTNTATGFAQPTETNSSGLYMFVGLVPGSYEVKAEARGFKPAQVTDITLLTGQEYRADLQLHVGEVTQAIDVVASAPALQETSAEISTVYSSKEMESLPLPQRDVYMVIDLTPGIAAGSTDPTQGEFNKNMSVNGGRYMGTNYTVDGGPTQGNGGLSERLGSQEAFAEVKVTTNTFAPEFGRNGGGNVQFAVKSGTKDYHGSGFFYYRDNSWNAPSWNSNARGVTTVATRTRKDLGGTVGGPVALPRLKHKLFFFHSYEYQRDAQPRDRSATIPDLDLRTGDFSRFAYAVISDPLAGTPFPGNRIPSNRLDPAAAKFLAALPKPNSTANPSTRYPGLYTNNLTKSTFNVDPQNYFLTRIDFYASEKDRFWFTHSALHEGPSTAGIAYDPPYGVYESGAGPRVRTTWRGVLAYTRTFSPAMVNELSASAHRDPRVIQPYSGPYDITRELGIPRKLGPNMIAIKFPNTFTQLGNNNIQNYINQPANLSDTMTWMKGSHTLRFGASLYQSQYWQGKQGDLSGTMSFNGEATKGKDNPFNALADFLLGYVKTASAPVAQIPTNRVSSNWGFFFGDTWRASRKLTLMLGIREEFEARVVVKNNVYSRVDIPSGQLLVAGRNGVSRNLDLPNSYLNLAPRLGLAYRLQGSTVLRAGIGISHLPLVYDAKGTTYPGFTSSKDFNDPGTGRFQPFRFADGLPVEQIADVTDPFEQLANASVNSPMSVSNTTFLPGFRMPRLYQWNVILERSLPAHIIGSAGYVGSAGRNLARTVRGNTPTWDHAAEAIQPGFRSQPVRPFPIYSSFNAMAFDSYSNYHSLQLTANRRYRGGFIFLANYTFSKNLDNYSSYNDAMQLPELFRDIEYGPSGLDRTHSFRGAVVWDLPFGRRGFIMPENRWVTWLLGGFRWSTTFAATSGRALTIIQRNTNSNILSNQRPNVRDSGNLSDRIGEPIFQGAAMRWLLAESDPRFPFVQAGPLQIGNLGRGTTREPGYWSSHMQISRQFRLGRGDSKRIVTYRADALNALNHPVFTSLQTNMSDASFGLLTNTGQGRQLSMGLKFEF